ncbi:MAG: hypothetical protein ACP5T2_06635, partial [Thermoprotei archaeon]
WYYFVFSPRGFVWVGNPCGKTFNHLALLRLAVAGGVQLLRRGHDAGVKPTVNSFGKRPLKAGAKLTLDS